MNNLIQFNLSNEFISSTLTSNAIARIEANMPEIIRAKQSFGRTNSQTTAKLMSLTMLTSGSPYRVLRQCLAEIEKRYSALQETSFTIREAKIKSDILKKNYNDPLALLEAEKEDLKIYNSKNYIEGALKDIAAFQDAYTQVRINNNIREDWDEKDFELAEIEHHMKTGFLHAYRDIMSNELLNVATIEYLHQFGIHPQVAFNETKKYIDSISEDLNLDSSHLENWLKSMVQKYKHLYEIAVKSLGLDELHSDWSMYRT
jgi:hypothetical protein